MAQVNTPIEKLSASYKAYGAGKISKEQFDKDIANFIEASEDKAQAEKDVEWLLKSWTPIHHRYINDTPETPAEVKETAKKVVDLSPIDKLKQRYKKYGAGKIKLATFKKDIAKYVSGHEDQIKAETDVAWLISSHIPTLKKFEAEETSNEN